MEKHRRPSRPGSLKAVTGLQSVQIVEGEPMEEIGENADGATGAIDKECLERAKDVVCGGETWAEKSDRMLEEAKHKSSEKHNEVVSAMAKSNDDLRQEVFIMQMIHYYKSVFAQANLPLWLKTYRILSTSSSTGLIEVLVDATSLDGLKKSENYPKEGGLRRYFEETYGSPDSEAFKEAQRNFMQSLAGYSLISYLLGLGDRHNGNIMIDTQGRLMHIDFGFVMGMAPGHEFSMERAPFKFTKEYVEVMGGIKDPCYKEFERLFVEGFKAARANSQIALGLVEIMMYQSNYPCFTGSRYGGGKSQRRFEKRLMLNVSSTQIEKRARSLIRKSRDHWGTNAYDKFQQYSNGYAI
jgi:phosphatidylinositol 4-kinase